MQCAPYPDGHAKTDEEIRDVNAEACIHVFVCCLLFTYLCVKSSAALVVADKLP
jgi:hypothetical protein